MPIILATWEAEIWKDSSSRPVHANSLWDPHLQNNQTKTDWRNSPSGRIPVLQAWSLELNPHPTHKKRQMWAKILTPTLLDKIYLTFLSFRFSFSVKWK
jgi:hypothetical protein